MNILQIPDRPKIINELDRRYQEVKQLADRGIHNDSEAQQFINMVAHYQNYVIKNPITKKVFDKLFKEKSLKKVDDGLVKDAELLIQKLKDDRRKLITRARKLKIDINAYKSEPGHGQITGEMEFSFYLSLLDGYLDLPDDEQRTKDLPRAISNLTQLIFHLQKTGGKKSDLEKLRNDWILKSADYEKRLKNQDVYLDYMRINDYKAINFIWREVYRENDFDDSMMFQLSYGDLFEKNRNFTGQQQLNANDFVNEHMTHLQRMHNHLIDSVEGMPWFEKLRAWTVEHLGPTFVSLLVLLAIYYIAKRLGLELGFLDIKDRTGL